MSNYIRVNLLGSKKNEPNLLDCVSGNADYLVTGDEDLLVLNPFKGIQIIDYNSFQNILEKLYFFC